MEATARYWRIMWVQIRSYDDDKTVNVTIKVRRPDKWGSMRSKDYENNTVTLHYWSKLDRFNDDREYHRALLMNLPLKSILAIARDLAGRDLSTMFEPIIPNKR